MNKVAIAILALTLASPAIGDAGLVRAHVEGEALTLTVFTDPTPIRVGPVDISALIQTRDTDELRFGEIEATLTPPEGGEISVPLTRADASTRFMQAAKFTLPEPGGWQVRIVARSGTDTVDARFELQVADALPRWIDLWPWFLPVPVVLGLWALTRRP